MCTFPRIFPKALSKPFPDWTVNKWTNKLLECESYFRANFFCPNCWIKFAKNIKIWQFYFPTIINNFSIRSLAGLRQKKVTERKKWRNVHTPYGFFTNQVPKVLIMQNAIFAIRNSHYWNVIRWILLIFFKFFENNCHFL